MLFMNTDELKNLIENSKDDPAGGYKLKIKVCANSKKNGLECSEILNLPKSNISILNGEKSSQKCLLIKPKGNIIKRK